MTDANAESCTHPAWRPWTVTGEIRWVCVSCGKVRDWNEGNK